MENSIHFDFSAGELKTVREVSVEHLTLQEEGVGTDHTMDDGCN